MTLQCPSCAAAILPAGINIERLVATCGACGEVFAFAPPATTKRKRRRKVPRTPRPESITVSEEAPASPSDPGYREGATQAAPGTLVLRRRWFSFQTVFLLFFAVFWDGFLGVWYSIALDAPGPGAIMVLFPLLHVAAGVWVTYTALTGLFNHSEIQVNGETLSVRHGPLPWPGNMVVKASELRQLFVRERVTRGRRGSTSTTYALCADIDGVARDLLRSLRSEDEARYLEQTIEAHLSIVDDPTAGGA